MLIPSVRIDVGLRHLCVLRRSYITYANNMGCCVIYANRAVVIPSMCPTPFLYNLCLMLWGFDIPFFWEGVYCVRLPYWRIGGGVRPRVPIGGLYNARFISRHSAPLPTSHTVPILHALSYSYGEAVEALPVIQRRSYSCVAQMSLTSCSKKHLTK